MSQQPHSAPADLHAEAVASATSGADRRRSARVSKKIPGWVSSESPDRSASGHDVIVADLSLHGVGFWDPRQRYRVGAKHWIVVSGEQLRLSTRVKIVSCRPSRGGTGYDVGATFF